MQDNWDARFTAEALAKVDRFIADHDGLTRQGVHQPAQGATNRVFFVRRDGGLVVFKVFCETERKERECFGLRHWHKTGLVPDLIWDADPRMIVMSHVPGLWLDDARKVEGEQSWADASREAGKAIGLLTQTPLSSADRAWFESHFYAELPTLESYLGRILELGRAIHARDPDFRDGFWSKSLLFIEAAMPYILAQPRVLYHQDVGNLHVLDGRFTGFFDLEMCRVGCEAMQLGAVAVGAVSWACFREGWEAATGKPLTPRDAAAAVAAGQLLGWREISRYLSYDGAPGTGFDWAAPADPARYRRSFEEADGLLQTGAF
jgi:hypothetical protein